MDLTKQFLQFSMLSWEKLTNLLCPTPLHYKLNLELQTILPSYSLILPYLFCQFISTFRHYFECETALNNCFYSLCILSRSNNCCIKNNFRFVKCWYRIYFLQFHEIYKQRRRTNEKWRNWAIQKQTLIQFLK